jgi:hypothetical protein
MLNDVQRGAVLDRASRVLEFGLAEDITAGFLGDAVEPD